MHGYAFIYTCVSVSLHLSKEHSSVDSCSVRAEHGTETTYWCAQMLALKSTDPRSFQKKKKTSATRQHLGLSRSSSMLTAAVHTLNLITTCAQSIVNIHCTPCYNCVQHDLENCQCDMVSQCCFSLDHGENNNNNRESAKCQNARCFCLGVQTSMLTW
jgi:hypothetical protein